MDSRLRLKALAGGLAMVLLVTLAVLYGNREQTTATEYEELQEEAWQNEGQIGNDLSAFVRDEEFFDTE